MKPAPCASRNANDFAMDATTALLATAGVSLFLFLAILCNCGRATASSDVAAVVRILACSSEGVGEGVRRFTSRWLEHQRLDRVLRGFPRSPHHYT